MVGNVSFDNNTAEYGAGFVASNHSSIIFSKNSVVTFSQNVANHSGGAILINHFLALLLRPTLSLHLVIIQQSNIVVDPYINSDIILKENSVVQFNKNMAKFGGAICIETNFYI